ncbi:MAG TPA: thioredoxin family protein [bacterium]|jgi:hypothetical protein
MNKSNIIEIFSADCFLCDEAIEAVKKSAGSDWEIKILDIRQPESIEKAKSYGIKRIPAVVVNGNTNLLCPGCVNDKAALKAAGINS